MKGMTKAKELHMRFFVGKLVIACLLLAATNAEGGLPEAELYWPQWRGPFGTGVSSSAQPPLEWGETKNVRWPALRHPRDV